jgi:hypothetical protein
MSYKEGCINKSVSWVEDDSIEKGNQVIIIAQYNHKRFTSGLGYVVLRKEDGTAFCIDSEFVSLNEDIPVVKINS